MINVNYFRDITDYFSMRFKSSKHGWFVLERIGTLFGHTSYHEMIIFQK